MKLGVLLLNFGEPEEATMEAVVPFLERIFALNAQGAQGAVDLSFLHRDRALGPHRLHVAELRDENAAVTRELDQVERFGGNLPPIRAFDPPPVGALRVITPRTKS